MGYAVEALLKAPPISVPSQDNFISGFFLLYIRAGLYNITSAAAFDSKFFSFVFKSQSLLLLDVLEKITTPQAATARKVEPRTWRGITL